MKKKKTFSLVEPAIDAGSDCRPEIAVAQDILQSRCKLLNPADQVLFQLASEGRYTHARIASLMGISESCLSLRISRLIRMLTRDFPMLFGHSHRCKINSWKILRMARLHRQSLHAMARHTGLSLYQVRKSIAGLKRIPKTKN